MGRRSIDKSKNGYLLGTYETYIPDSMWGTLQGKEEDPDLKVLILVLIDESIHMKL